jgi:ubiquinone/menaquinone biosynthesis C-methylase UbiE
MNTTDDIRNFWEANPLCAEYIEHEQGTRELFDEHNRMSRLEEPLEFQRKVYEFDKWSGKSVLDVGCGTGYVVYTYASNGAKVTGVDIADKSVELTKKRLEIYGLTAETLRANAEELPFFDNSFYLVTSYGVLHHTPDTEKAVQEVFRVLKPGGRVIMMFYHKNSFAYRILFPLKRVFQSKWRGKTPQEQVNSVDGAQNPLGKVYNRNDLKNMMKGFGQFEFFTGMMFC